MQAKKETNQGEITGVNSVSLFFCPLTKGKQSVRAARDDSLFIFSERPTVVGFSTTSQKVYMTFN